MFRGDQTFKTVLVPGLFFGGDKTCSKAVYIYVLKEKSFVQKLGTQNVLQGKLFFHCSTILDNGFSVVSHQEKESTSILNV